MSMNLASIAFRRIVCHRHFIDDGACSAVDIENCRYQSFACEGFAGVTGTEPATQGNGYNCENCSQGGVVFQTPLQTEDLV